MIGTRQPLAVFVFANSLRQTFRMLERGYAHTIAFKPLRIVAASVQAWLSDRCASMAAALAFYAAFSMAPMLVIVIAVAGFFFGPQAVEGRLFSDIAGLVGKEGATALQAMVASAWKADRSGWTALISVIAVFFGASATFAQLNTSLNTIWRVPSTQARQALFSLVKVRLISFGLVIGIAFLIMVLLVMDAVLSFVVEWIVGASADARQWIQLIQHGTILIVLTAAFGAMLKVLPETPVRWPSVWLGAGTAAVLFDVGKNLFGLYLARAGTANAFGAAGSLAVLLMWLYFSSAVFLLGAELAAHCGVRLPEANNAHFDATPAEQPENERSKEVPFLLK
ncbi:MAG TPA: YihY/virulence factor BrkB family protein [Rhodocyclaceae bacterium]|nr:YihY/virulence factor BrkB family protein [Rhodocyclaceae bacterium]